MSLAQQRRLTHETPDQREARLEQVSLAQQRRLTHETPEETATRCEQDRESHRRQREQQSVRTKIVNFHSHLAAPLSDLEFHGSVFSIARGSLGRDGPLSDPESHGSVSSVVQCPYARDGPLSDPESHGSISFAAQGSYAREDLFSGLKSLTLIALSCEPKLSPTGQQTAKHNGLYPLLSVLPPFVERFQQRDDPCRVGFYALAFLSFLRIP